MTPRQLHQVRRLLCRLEDAIRDTLLAARDSRAAADFARVASVTAADTIYQVDRISEEAILTWFGAHWPARWPVELVMEGLEGEAITFPRGTSVAKTEFKCILDPIDGTRSLMYDKRSAWVLAAVAPQRGKKTHLGDVVVAAMTELPTSKQWAADQVSGVKGCGRSGLVAERVNVHEGGRCRLTPRPSRATDFRHGFASLARFFPEGKGLLAQVEEDLWGALGLGGNSSPLVFDDQYISTGGQLYELLMGHDRMLGDLRPRAFRKLGLDSPLVCHPYDVCTALLLQEAGGVVETPEGAPLRPPLDTTTPVAWMGYANRDLVRLVRPVLRRLLREYFA